MVRYRIFYGDSSTFSDYEETPFDAPGHNVQFIAMVDENVGWKCVRYYDYYFWCEAGQGFEEGWNGGDWSALFDYLTHYKGPQKVLMGRTIGNAEFAAIHDRACNDDYLPQKSGYYPREPRPGKVAF